VAGTVGECVTRTSLRSSDDRYVPRVYAVALCRRAAPAPVGAHPDGPRGRRVNVGAPQVVRVEHRHDLPTILHTWGIGGPRPVLVCIGGASRMSKEIATTLGVAFQDLVAPALDRWSATVVDGGTDAGLMRMVGRARAGAGCSFPLVGVAAIGTVELPDTPRPEDGAPLEPNHTHVVLVPGDSWGDETPWLSAVAGAIARDQRSVTLMVNGGAIALNDAEESLAAGRPLIVLAGSGRSADEIVKARAGDEAGEQARVVAASPLTSIVDARNPGAILDGIAAALVADRPDR
jgi:SLOG in TRPM, prokaryote